MSKKQDLARKRNWAKFRLSGFTMSIDGMSEEEAKLIKTMLTIRSILLHRFDANSKELGLNIRNKQSSLEL